MSTREIAAPRFRLPSKAIIKFAEDPKENKAVLVAVTSDLAEAEGTTTFPLRRGKNALTEFAALILEYSASQGKKNQRTGTTLCDLLRKYPKWFQSFLSGLSTGDRDLKTRVNALFFSRLGNPSRTELREPWKNIDVVLLYEGIQQPREIFQDVANYISPTQKEIQPGDVKPRWRSSEPPDDIVWAKVRRACYSSNLAASGKIRLNSDPNLYVRRSLIEQELEKFIDSSDAGLVMIGESGHGKTTCISRFREQLVAANHTVLFLTSIDIDLTFGLERNLSQVLAAGGDLADILASVHSNLVRERRCLVIIFDAINEFSPSSGHGPAELVSQIDSKLVQLIARSGWKYIKCVMTCRTKTWQARVTAYRRSIMSDAYYSGIPLVLERFDGSERKIAFERYTAKYGLKSSYGDLSSANKKVLADPFILQLTAITFEGRRLPADIDSGEVIERYYNEKVKGAAMREFLSGVADYLLESGSNSLLVAELDGSAKWQALRGELLDESPRSRVLEAIDSGILSQSVVNEMLQYRFTYDRFQEFVLAKALLRKIAHSESFSGSSWDTTKGTIVSVISMQVQRIYLLSTLPGALQVLLKFIYRGELMYRVRQEPRAIRKEQFGEIVHALLALEDPRLTEILTDLVREVVPKDPTLLPILSTRSSVSVTATGGLLDISFSLIISPDFKEHWQGCQPALQKQYHVILHNAFSHSLNSTTSLKIRAVEYIYLLWRCEINNENEWPYFREHAETIIQSAIDEIGIFHLLARPGKRETFKYIVMLLFLILAESCEEVKKVSRVVRFLRLILEKCHAGTLTHVPETVIEALANTMREGFSLLPNPVNMNEIEALLRDAQASRSIKEAIELADPLNETLRNLSFEKICAFAENNNSVVRQVFIHALSSKHRRAEFSTARDSLDLLEKLFARGTPSARYVASIAVYHINYFGENSSERSLKIMSEMAECILREHRGRLPAFEGREPYDFNIIGTLGRVLIKHGHPRNADILDYAIREIKRAKAEKDSMYYAYVVRNIGLLGTLAPPRKALEFLRYVLEDIGELHCDNLDSSIFNRADLTAIALRTFESLAKIRTRFRQEVDRFLLDADESRRLYEKVRAIATSYDLGLYSSWYWEELVQKTLVYHPEFAHKLLALLKTTFFEAENPLSASIHFVRAFLKFDREASGFKVGS